MSILATKDELELENTMLQEENERLREQLAEAQRDGGGNTRPAPVQPSFGISEGTRAELEQNGKATDPFTGKALTREDLEGQTDYVPAALDYPGDVR